MKMSKMEKLKLILMDPFFIGIVHHSKKLTHFPMLSIVNMESQSLLKLYLKGQLSH